MAMPGFIREDPYLARRDTTIANRQAQAFNDVQLETSMFNLDEGRRTSDEAQAQDEAIRRALAAYQDIGSPQQTQAPQPGAFAAGAGGPPAAPVVSPPATTQTGGGFYGNTQNLNSRLATELSAVPGSGMMALETTRENIGMQFNLMKEGLAIAERDPAMARQFFAQSGMPVPDEMADLLTNREARQEFSAILAEAENLYPGQHNAQNAWRYVEGRLSGAIEAGNLSGAPAPSNEAPINLQQMTDPDGNVWAWNPRTNSMQPVNRPDGAQFNAGVAAGDAEWELEETDQGLMWVNKRTLQAVRAVTVEQGEPQQTRSGPPNTAQVTPTTVTQLTTNRTGGSGGAGPAAVQLAEWTAGHLAAAAGRDQPTPEDYLEAVAMGKRAASSPYERARVITDMMTIIQKSNETMGIYEMSAQDLERQATEAVDRMIAESGGAASSLQGNAGNAGLGGGAPANLQGAGTQQDPYQATAQEDVDWFRDNAPPGAVIVIDGQAYTK